MSSKWIEFVKKWAIDNNTTYGCALSQSECKNAYHKQYNTKKYQKERTLKENQEMGSEDIRSQIIETQNKKKKILDKYELQTKANQLKKMPQGRAELRNEVLKKQMEDYKEKQGLGEEIYIIPKKKSKKKSSLSSTKQIPGYSIELLDEYQLQQIFDKNYDAGDDSLLISVKSPNGNYYNENDWNDMINYINNNFIDKKVFTQRFSSLLKYLKKKNIINYTATNLTTFI